MKVNLMTVLLINALHYLNDWNSLSYCEGTDGTADTRGAELGRAALPPFIFGDCSDTVKNLQEII
jgi:hypothetical protein